MPHNSLAVRRVAPSRRPVRVAERCASHAAESEVGTVNGRGIGLMAGRSDRTLPASRGVLSDFVIETLSERRRGPAPVVDPLDDPLVDDDLHLALYLCYELHYQSFAGVADDWEWDPELLAFRHQLEACFLGRLVDDAATLPVRAAGEVTEALTRLIAANDGPSLSTHMETSGDLSQMREFAAHRSAYQRKEADPHTWAIPRLSGLPKAALIRIQADEYGFGRHDEMHSERFAVTMEALGLDSTYGAYLALLPGSTLASVNIISFFGLHRRWRGALVGHLAVYELTSVVPMARYSAALARLGIAADAQQFYDVHVAADAEHQWIALKDLAGELAQQEPGLSRDILFGAQATLGVEGRFAQHLLDSWARDASSLRERHVAT